MKKPKPRLWIFLRCEFRQDLKSKDRSTKNLNGTFYHFLAAKIKGKTDLGEHSREGTHPQHTAEAGPENINKEKNIYIKSAKTICN